MDLQEGQLAMTTDMSVALEDEANPVQQSHSLHPVVSHVKDKFTRSKNKRQLDETRWLEAYRNYRGLYGPDVQFTETEKSRIFVKVTKTKVMAAFAQICDVLFAGGKFPLGIEPTPHPEGEGVGDFHIDFEKRTQAAPASSSTSLATRPELMALLPKALEGKVQPEQVKEGPGKTPTTITYEPALEAARKMEKKIHDQLVESEADKHLRIMAFEMALFGTGIMKGPFSVIKEYPRWTSSEAEGKTLAEYDPVIKTVPKISSVSIWNFYPDAEAYNMAESEYAIERHKLSAHQVRQLKKRPAFMPEAIDLALSYGPDYVPEYWESILEDNNYTTPQDRYEVLEYWGMIPTDSEILQDLELDEELLDQDEVQVNIWVCNNTVIRFVVNPYVPTIIPYYATPYEVNPYSFFGVGIAENMADTQLLMNGVMRMTVDNLALSGNVILEVNESQLVPGQDMQLYPGKIFRTQGQPGTSINSINVDSVTQDLMAVYDKARQLTDESTNMPSYAHGGTGVQGMGRTASGMSMLMGAAAQSIKSIIRNIDDYFLSPCGRALFAFNMQYDYDPDIKGDLEVVARGTDSLMRNEIRSQRLLQFLQTGTANPATAPLVKVDYILRELAYSLELDADKVVNDPREMMIQAELIKQMSEAMGVNTNPAGQQQGGAPNVSDPTGNGGGNIAPGNAPSPGAAGFTGSGGGANGGNTTPPQQQGNI